MTTRTMTFFCEANRITFESDGRNIKINIGTTTSIMSMSQAVSMVEKLNEWVAGCETGPASILYASHKEARFQKMETKFDILEEKFKTLHKGVVELETRFMKGDSDSKIKGLSANVDSIDRRLNNHMGRIDNIERSLCNIKNAFKED